MSYYFRFAVGMPDLHPGHGFPIGAAIGSVDFIHPYLVGGDIGCGMSFVELDLPVESITDKKIDRWSRLLEVAANDEFLYLPESPIQSLEEELIWGNRPILAVSEDRIPTFMEGRRHQLNLRQFDRSLGTIGGGNHFCELQKIVTIYRNEILISHGIDSTKLFMLVHSGSRGFGAAILDSNISRNGINGLIFPSTAATEYMQAHDVAVDWACRNRYCITLRVLDILGINKNGLKCCLDIVHNCVECQRTECYTDKNNLKDTKTDIFIHRKGAAPSDRGLVVIPGSRGDASYLVMPTINENALPHMKAGFSLAHGAGRKLHRSEAAALMHEKYKRDTDSLKNTELGSRVVCRDNELLFEEAPEAYKDIHTVVFDLVQYGLIDIIAVMHPILTFKG